MASAAVKNKGLPICKYWSEGSLTGHEWVGLSGNAPNPFSPTLFTSTKKSLALPQLELAFRWVRSYRKSTRTNLLN